MRAAKRKCPDFRKLPVIEVFLSHSARYSLISQKNSALSRQVMSEVNQEGMSSGNPTDLGDLAECAEGTLVIVFFYNRR